MLLLAVCIGCCLLDLCWIVCWVVVVCDAECGWLGVMLCGCCGCMWVDGVVCFGICVDSVGVDA